jgi:ribosomal protein S12 methylthiotransferase accessory factor
VRDAFGVTRLARITGLDRTGVEVACAIRPGGHVLQVSNGKGRTFAHAARAALSEAAELAAAEQVPLPRLRFGTRAQLAAGGLPTTVLPAPEGTDDVVLSWVEGKGTLTGARTWVPAQAVYCPPAGALLGPALFTWTSNGLAAHPRVVPAVRHALREVIERDQLARALPRGWTAREVSRRRLPEAALPASVRSRLEDLARRGFLLGLFDLRPAGGLGVPVAGALLLDEPGSPVPMTAGYAAAADWATALEGAALEAAQSRLTDIHGAREDVGPSNGDEASAVRAWLERPVTPRGRGVRGGRRLSASAEVAWLSRCCLRGGLGEPVVVSLRGEPIHVVRVLVPGALTSGLL